MRLELNLYRGLSWSSLILCLIIFVDFTSAYNEGRLGGASPSAKYLREHPHQLRHSRGGMPKRAKFGSSYYLPENYRKAVYDGEIYWSGHQYGWYQEAGRPMPTICTNNEKLRPESNDTKLGFFICPMAEHSDVYMTYCCGEVEHEYCCDEFTAEIFYYSRTAEDDARDMGIVFIILAVIFGPFLLGIIIFAICKKC